MLKGSTATDPDKTVLDAAGRFAWHLSDGWCSGFFPGLWLMAGKPRDPGALIALVAFLMGSGYSTDGMMHGGKSES